MKRVLFLDDSPERQKTMRLYLGPDRAFTAQQAIDKLAESMTAFKPYDVVFLDHDLGGKEHVDSDGPEETGYTVAKWIVENRPYIPIIIVHSLNQPGATRIADCLIAAGYLALKVSYLTLKADPRLVLDTAVDSDPISDHDKYRRDKALNCDKNNLLEVEDAVRGLQSTDHPPLLPLHDILMKRLKELEANENRNTG